MGFRLSHMRSKIHKAVLMILKFENHHVDLPMVIGCCLELLVQCDFFDILCMPIYQLKLN